MDPYDQDEREPGPPRTEDAAPDHYRMLVHLHQMIMHEHRYDEENPCELARKLAAMRTELHARDRGLHAR